MPPPLVSVVVSTYERPDRLARLLGRLREQTLAAGAFEVIVVDDASGPETLVVLRAEQARDVLTLRFARHPFNQGQSAGRNTGWRLAQAPLVAFTDDDCAPARGWLAALVAVAEHEPGTIVQGVTVPDPGDAGGSLLFARRVWSNALGPQYETCNIAYPRALLESLGGFDVRFSVGEDTDLAFRAFAAGHRAVFAPEAIVEHAVARPGALAILRGATRWGGLAPIFAAHPEARVVLHHRIFWNPWHYLLIRSAVSLAGPRWLRRIVISHHLRLLRRRARELGAGPAAVPYLLLFDAIETAAMVRGAIRQRTPLL